MMADVAMSTDPIEFRPLARSVEARPSRNEYGQSSASDMEPTQAALRADESTSDGFTAANQLFTVPAPIVSS